MKFSHLPLRLRAYLLTSAIAAVTLGYATRGLHAPGDPGLLAVLLVLTAVAGGLKVSLTVRWGRMTLGFAVTYFTLLTLGIPAAVLVNALSAVSSLALNRKQGQHRFGLRGIPFISLPSTSRTTSSVSSWPVSASGC
jgi:hypothetical protein